MALYIHSPIRLHGVVLNQLSTGTTLPSYLYILQRSDIFLKLQPSFAFAAITAVNIKGTSFWDIPHEISDECIASIFRLKSKLSEIHAASCWLLDLYPEDGSHIPEHDNVSDRIVTAGKSRV
jgi:hypothetical protein